MNISKNDWKLFCKKLPDWQERYIERLIRKYVKLLDDDTKLPSEKFWKLNKQIEIDKRHPGVITDIRKSEAIWSIISLIRLKVISLDDLLDFSGELQNQIKTIILNGDFK